MVAFSIPVTKYRTRSNLEEKKKSLFLAHGMSEFKLLCGDGMATLDFVVVGACSGSLILVDREQADNTKLSWAPKLKIYHPSDTLPSGRLHLLKQWFSTFLMF